MKTKIYPFLYFACAALIFPSCSTKPTETTTTETTEEAATEEWKEMDEFHTLMAESFHPYKDSSNLEPAKANAALMAAAATKWKNATIPAKVDNEGTTAKLAQLELDALAFQDLVEQNDSTKLGESLTGLHDLFHELQESWYSGEDHSEHHPK